MKQQTLAMAADQGDGFERYRRAAKRDVFLSAMDEIVPWDALCELIEPFPGNGRPPVGLRRMLRMYFVQHWFNLADEACEEAHHRALRRFASTQVRERVARRHAEVSPASSQRFGRAAFAAGPSAAGPRAESWSTGTIVDATIIGAPSSTKNADKARDPGYQTRKGQRGTSA